ncbi:MAG: hypothetical protein KatS3mg002_0959 [Candidatus Woesearchaeota archaeon]|nr:MAG: hypothetical protein KatS3mg002_0959 [Candidatus Woesearchaeota archaeon]
MGISGFWFFSNNNDNSLLDVSIQAYTQEYLPGQEVNYGIELVNMGKSKRFDATIRYTITDNTGRIYRSYTETLAVETKTTSNGKLLLPSNLRTGTYYLNAIVTYGDNKKAESSTEIYIVDRINNSINNINNNLNNNINNNLNNPSNPQTNTLNTRGSNRKSFGETMILIKQQSVNNPQVAFNTCLKFTDINQKDICINEIAYTTNRVAYCDQISNSDKKDNCYLAFVILGNTQICEKIKNANLKGYCEQTRIVEQMNQYYIQGNNEKVLELSRQFEPALYNTNPVPMNYQESYNQVSSLSINDFTLTGELE